jgi:telomerase reverse transcriptase
MRKFENLPLEMIVKGLKISDCDWASLSKPNTKIPNSESEQQKILVYTFTRFRSSYNIRWLFDSFITTLIKTCFYVTESAIHRHRLFYFRQSTWQILTRPHLDKLTLSNMHETTRELSVDAKLGHCTVRLLPKENGTRPIMNLGRIIPQQGKSVNGILKNALKILECERV